MKQQIEILNNKFEILKDKFSNDEIILVYAQLEIESLLKLATKLSMKAIEQEDTISINSLINQMNEFSELIEDLLDKKLNLS